MRRYQLLIAIFLLFAGTLKAQSSYEDSLQAHRLRYKKDLYPVIKNDTSLVHFFPADPQYRVVATAEKLTGEKFFSMSTSSGMAKQAIRYVRLTFTLHGTVHTVYGYQLSMLLETEKYRDDFFIPFIDETSGTESYMSGKYIDFSTKDISGDNKLVIDFNKSYNPYCAFRKGYNCPLPPKENYIMTAIRAGEMHFSK